MHLSSTISSQLSSNDVTCVVCHDEHELHAPKPILALSGRLDGSLHLLLMLYILLQRKFKFQIWTSKLTPYCYLFHNLWYVHLSLSFHNLFCNWSEIKNLSNAFCTHKSHHGLLPPALFVIFPFTPFILRFLSGAVEWIVAIGRSIFWHLF